MKPQFFLTVCLMMLVLIYLPVDASRNFVPAADDHETHKNPIVARSVHPEPSPLPQPGEKQPLMNHKEKGTPHHSSKAHHAEEDGKHHHFHMDRVKRIRRFCNIFTFLTKCFLAITHICILISVFRAIVAH